MGRDETGKGGSGLCGIGSSVLGRNCLGRENSQGKGSEAGVGEREGGEEGWELLAAGIGEGPAEPPKPS